MMKTVAYLGAAVGILLLVVGVVLCLTIVGLPIGLPLGAAGYALGFFSLRHLRRGKVAEHGHQAI